MTNFSLSQHFHQYFEAIPVRDEATRQKVFQLRYEVYCEELHFENTEAFPDHQEHDDYDAHSEFVLLRHRESGRSAGCVRLILNHKDPELRFPFELACGEHFDQSQYDPEHIDRSRIAEISRLAVHSHFRRRTGEAATPEGTAEPASYFGGERHYPIVAMGLFLSVSALALNLGLDQVLVMMEPRLARLLGSCGIRFSQIGDIIDYHGRRGPFRITRDELLNSLSPEAMSFINDLRTALR